MLTLEERQVWATRSFLYFFTQKVKKTHFHATCLLTPSVFCPLSSIFKTFQANNIKGPFLVISIQIATYGFN